MWLPLQRIIYGQTNHLCDPSLGIEVAHLDWAEVIAVTILLMISQRSGEANPNNGNCIPQDKVMETCIGTAAVGDERPSVWPSRLGQQQSETDGLETTRRQSAGDCGDSKEDITGLTVDGVTGDVSENPPYQPYWQCHHRRGVGRPQD